MAARILITTSPVDDWDQLAHELFHLCTRGSGTPHAKEAKLRKAVLDVAAENFRAGEDKARSEGAGAPDWSKGLDPESALALLAHVQRILLPIVPSRPEGHSAVELAQAAAAGAQRAMTLHEAVEVADADLMETMVMADEFAADQGPILAESRGIIAAELKRLAIEVARLRKGAKA
jgi:hypothetical protein